MKSSTLIVATVAGMSAGRAITDESTPPAPWGTSEMDAHRNAVLATNAHFDWDEHRRKTDSRVAVATGFVDLLFIGFIIIFVAALVLK